LLRIGISQEKNGMVKCCVLSWQADLYRDMKALTQTGHTTRVDHLHGDFFAFGDVQCLVSGLMGNFVREDDNPLAFPQLGRNGVFLACKYLQVNADLSGCPQIVLLEAVHPADQ
jgi:hypothetical protein